MVHHMVVMDRCCYLPVPSRQNLRVLAASTGSRFAHPRTLCSPPPLLIFCAVPALPPFLICGPNMLWFLQCRCRTVLIAGGLLIIVKPPSLMSLMRVWADHVHGKRHPPRTSKFWLREERIRTRRGLFDGAVHRHDTAAAEAAQALEQHGPAPRGVLARVIRHDHRGTRITLFARASSRP